MGAGFDAWTAITIRAGHALTRGAFSFRRPEIQDGRAKLGGMPWCRVKHNKCCKNHQPYKNENNEYCKGLGVHRLTYIEAKVWILLQKAR